MWFLWWTGPPLNVVLMHPAVVSHPASFMSHHLRRSPPPPHHLFGRSGYLELTTMQLCKTINFCPLFLALLDLTDAELRESNEFNIIRNFRLFHTGCLEEREQHHKLFHLRFKSMTAIAHHTEEEIHSVHSVCTYQFKSHIFVILRIINNLLQIGSN